MASSLVPRFVTFARKLTLVSGLAIPLAGCAGCASTTPNSDDSSMPGLGVKPLPQDAADDADAQSQPEVAADVPAETATDDAAEPESCWPHHPIGVAVMPPDAGDDASIAPPGVKPMPADAGSGNCDGGIVPVGGPLAPPEFLA